MSYRRISLDTAEQEYEHLRTNREVAKLMRELPTPECERGTVVLTPNGNIVTKVTR